MLKLRSFTPQDRTLLERYAAYVSEVDGVKASLQDHAESLILYALEEHEGFQAWLANSEKYCMERSDYFAQQRRRHFVVYTTKGNCNEV